MDIFGFLVEQNKLFEMLLEIKMGILKTMNYFLTFYEKKIDYTPCPPNIC